ncbi:DUF1330 domain-containing protein [Streptomyces sp. WAC06614]|uniref:DUF1330 domain-containing protein n=1 Tax=Streptomyces sp. WAC06614 TaxID=2487416 RepID=UPI000F76E959|nr:DUF1330 domain-containing protein [Streptomyces sp. WAC06614]RSS72775.1 DUF1330 domain-containing protein [Streptomyces sp. WAC06614]
MTAYAIGHIRPGALHEDVLRYIETIESTFEPFGGRFLVHGAEVEVKEGTWPGTVVVIAFPGLDAARDWYDSEAYQDLVPLRTRHMPAEIILVDGVPEGYRAARTAAALRARAGL